MTMNTEKELTGYPSIDKPWLKYYKPNMPETISPDMSIYNFLYENTKNNLDWTALNFFGKRITFKEMFNNIDTVASVLQTMGVKKGDIVTLCALNIPEFFYPSGWSNIMRTYNELRQQEEQEKLKSEPTPAEPKKNKPAKSTGLRHH